MRKSFYLLPFLLVTLCANAQESKRLLLGISKIEHQLVVMNADSYNVIAKIPIGEDPHEVTVSEDGKTAYVSNTGFGTLHEINAIDLVHLTPLKNIDTRPLWGPHGLDFKKNKLYFTAQGSKAVASWDVKSEKLDWSLGTGQDVTHLIHINPSLKEIYSSNSGSGTISIFEQKLLEPTVPPTGKLPTNAKPRLDWVQTVLNAGAGSEGFDVTPDEKELWTVKPDGTIAIVNLTNKQIIQQVDTKVLGLHRIAFSADGSKAIIVSVRTGDLLVYDVKSRKELKKINIGQGAGIMVDKKTNYAYISCTPNNYIIVFDIKKMEVIKKLEIGGRPDGMSIAEYN